MTANPPSLRSPDRFDLGGLFHHLPRKTLTEFRGRFKAMEQP